MSFRSNVKKNVPKVELQMYNVLVAGSFKSGKTRLWKEVMELHYPGNPDAGLLLAFEDGYTTWELDSYIDMHNRDWNYFKKEVVKGLVEEAKNGSITKVIGIDTVDRMIDMASEWLIKEWNSKYGKTYTSIQEFNENIKDENVYTALKKEIWTQIDTLKRAGYGFFWLAWTKEKETTTIDGLKYNSIELAMSKTGKDIFHSQAHLVCCLHDEVKVTDKHGDELAENQKNKRGKEVASKFHTSIPTMYFRKTNYIDIAGGRFTDLPEKEVYSAENFMEVFENAVKGQLKKTDQSVEQLREQQMQEQESKAKEFAELIEQKEEAEKNTPEALVKTIKETLKAKTKEEQQAAVKTAKEILGTTDFAKINDSNKLKQFLNAIQ